MMLAAIALAVAISGCGSDARSAAAPAPVGPISGLDAGRVDASPIAADAGSDAAPSPDSGPPKTDSGPTFGGLPLVEVEGSACAPAPVDARTLYAAEHAASGVAPAIDRVARVGSARVGGGNEAQGFVTFGEDGAPGPLVTPTIDFNLFASEGDAVAVAGGALGEVVFRRFDEHGAPLGSASVLAAAVPDALAIGARASTSLVAWASGGALSARAVIAGAPAAGPWTISSGTYGALASIAIGAGPESFAIAWTGDDAASARRTRVVLASATGVLGAPIEVLVTSSVVRAVRIVGTKAGFALLVASSPPDPRAYVVLLDAAARPVGAIHALAGTASAWDMAANGDAIAVVAQRADGAPAVRAFGTDGGALHALGAWACLDDGGDAGALGAIDADGDGWLVVHRTKDGATRVARVPRAASAIP